jgi:hypothetical protein
VTSKGKLNAEWHKEHPMPKNPTMAERVEWHFAHSDMCGCRPVPPSLVADVAALKTRRTRSRANWKQNRGHSPSPVCERMN